VFQNLILRPGGAQDKYPGVSEDVKKSKYQAFCGCKLLKKLA